MATHIMLDLETLGKAPGCIVLQIGACVFDRNGPTDQTFKTAISTAASRRLGLTTDTDTLAWWADQSGEAQAVLDECHAPGAPTPAEAAVYFNEFLRSANPNPDNLRLWGNGAAFDNVILRAMFAACGVEPEWPWWGDLCYRTLRAMRPDIERPAFVGTPHDALDDALNQARHAALLIENWQ